MMEGEGLYLVAEKKLQNQMFTLPTCNNSAKKWKIEKAALRQGLQKEIRDGAKAVPYEYQSRFFLNISE